MHTNLKSHLFRILCTIPLAGVVVCGMSATCNFYRIYTLHALRQQEGLWLFTQCKIPEFLKSLSQHSDACQKVNLVFAVTPLNMALNEFIQGFVDFSLHWQFHHTALLDKAFVISMLAMGILMLFILIPIYVATMERRERDRLAIIAFHQQELRKKKFDSPIRSSQAPIIPTPASIIHAPFLPPFQDPAPKLRWRTSHHHHSKA